MDSEKMIFYVFFKNHEPFMLCLIQVIINPEFLFLNTQSPIRKIWFLEIKGKGKEYYYDCKLKYEGNIQMKN